MDRTDLEAYVERLMEALEADGVVLAIRKGDRYELVDEEPDVAMLRRLARRLDLRAGRAENLKEARDILNEAAEDDE